ncbi:hypothetical protein B0T18DRAFT_213862 [Schizothecium vesticola]|uniref:Uncharacterized protein n=1 Tax=Schizothecium vesticola TaxID=314040 RepID=A0AA40EJT4_9PEZI|nr:hypothetical protein B0T18DRAFT_213862 [Schizothecium vesticola]
MKGGGDKGAEMVARASIRMTERGKGDSTKRRGGVAEDGCQRIDAMSLEVVMVVGWSVRADARRRGATYRVKCFFQDTRRIPSRSLSPSLPLHAIIRIGDDDDGGLGRRGSLARLEPGSSSKDKSDIPKINLTSESATGCRSGRLRVPGKGLETAKADKKTDWHDNRRPTTCRCGSFPSKRGPGIRPVARNRVLGYRASGESLESHHPRRGIFRWLGTTPIGDDFAGGC